jgi:hypothetical protein
MKLRLSTDIRHRTFTFKREKHNCSEPDEANSFHLPSFLIRIHKYVPEVFNYLMFLARSVTQQAKEERAGLLLGGVGAVDGL